MAFKPIIEKSTSLEDITIIRPNEFKEHRGSIWTSFSNDYYNSLVPVNFNHDKFSISKKNVLRGIHGDHKSWKLISCPHGDILAVIVDMRPDSQSYLKHESFRINRDNNIQILLPPGFGNSFYVFSKDALYHYKLAYEGEYIDADDQFTIAWNDPRLNINWPTKDPILSNRDARL